MRAFFLMTQAGKKKPMPGFFDEIVYSFGKLRQLVCHRFWQCLQTASLAKVCLHTEQTCCSSRAFLPHSSTHSQTATLSRAPFVISVRFGNTHKFLNFWRVLAHLSRRLTGELIVYPCSGVRPSSSSSFVRPSSVRRPPRWPPCPYMVKTLQKSSSPEPVDRFQQNLA